MDDRSSNDRMMRHCMVRTRLRPIKKVFVLEPQSLKRFLAILGSISRQLDGVSSNVFLLNDGRLACPSNAEFVRRFDPDVVINCSRKRDAYIETLFRRPTYRASGSKKVIEKLGFPLYCFSNLPSTFRRLGGDFAGETLRYNDAGVGDSAGIFQVVHYGQLRKSEIRRLASGARFLRDAEMKALTSLSEAARYASHESNIFRLATTLLQSAGSRSQSIWATSQNPKRYFDDKHRVAVIGRHDDLASIVFFWNCRAAYPHTQSLWVPVDCIDALTERIREFECISLADSVKVDDLPECLRDKAQVPQDQLYFDEGFNDNWSAYEATQMVGWSPGSKITVVHPCDRLFSTLGMNLGVALDIAGFDHFYFPLSLTVGELFEPSQQITGKREATFCRIGGGRLVKHIEQFEWLEPADLLASFRLPGMWEMLEAYFRERGVQVQRSDKSGPAERLAELLGYPDGLNLLADPEIFDLLVRLTPKRVSRIVQDLSRRVGVSERRLEDAIEAVMPPEQGLLTDIVVDLANMACQSGVSQSNRASFFGKVQLLYDRGVLLRGKALRCPHCNSKLWLALEEISETNRCYCCRGPVAIPVANSAAPDADAYRLNELASRAVDQGQLPVLLTARFFAQQPFRGIHQFYNLAVRDETTDRIRGDIDILVKLGARIGIGEVKADRGVTRRQVDELLRVASDLSCDFVFFSSLKDACSPEVSQLMDYLQAVTWDTPCFVLSREALFAERPESLGPYFEVSRTDHSRFPTGPFIVAKRPVPPR